MAKQCVYCNPLQNKKGKHKETPARHPSGRSNANGLVSEKCDDVLRGIVVLLAHATQDRQAIEPRQHQVRAGSVLDGFGVDDLAIRRDDDLLLLPGLFDDRREHRLAVFQDLLRRDDLPARGPGVDGLPCGVGNVG